jgi:hypothetical protein
MMITAIIIVNVLLCIAMLGGLAHMMSHPTHLRPHGQDETTRRESTPTALSDALPTQAP